MGAFGLPRAHQPPLAARDGIAELPREATSLKDWDAILQSPFHGAWAVRALAAGMPAKPDPAAEARKDELMKGLSQRFKRL